MNWRRNHNLLRIPTDLAILVSRCWMWDLKSRLWSRCIPKYLQEDRHSILVLLKVSVGFWDEDLVRILRGMYNALDFCGFIWSLFALHHWERLSSSRLHVDSRRVDEGLFMIKQMLSANSLGFPKIALGRSLMKISNRMGAQNQTLRDAANGNWFTRRIYFIETYWF